MTDKLANFKYGLPDHQVAKIGGANRLRASTSDSAPPLSSETGGLANVTTPQAPQAVVTPMTQAPIDPPPDVHGADADEAVSASRKGFIALFLLGLAALYFSVLGLPSNPLSIKSTDRLDGVTGYLKGQTDTKMTLPATVQVADSIDTTPSKSFTLSKENASVATFFARKYHIATVQVQQYVHFAEQAAAAKGLDPALIMAVMSIESNLNPITESTMGAQGLMQVLTAMHVDKLSVYGGVSKVFDPESNIKVGATILADCIKLAGSLEGGLKCYVGATGPTDNGYGLKVLAEKDRIIKAKKGVFDFSPNNKVLLDIAQNSSATPDQQAAAKTGLAAAAAAAAIDSTSMNISNAAIVAADTSKTSGLGVTGNASNGEFNKDVSNVKDNAKEPAKDHSKDGFKETNKEGVKESGKEGIKETSKDSHKDTGKESLKNATKDIIKDINSKDNHSNGGAGASGAAHKPQPATSKPLVPSINIPAIPSQAVSQGVTYPTITTPPSTNANPNANPNANLSPATNPASGSSATSAPAAAPQAPN